MKLEKLKLHHNPELLQFFESFPLPGLVKLKIDRRGDFWGPYLRQSSEFVTYALRETSSMDLKAAASFVIKDTEVLGRKVRIAWARDLRVSSERSVLLNWAYHFLPVINEVREQNKVDAFFSIINLSDTGTLNAFLRPRPMKRPLPQYLLYRKFNLVTLHGRFPWAKPPLPALRIEAASRNQFDILADYIVSQCKHRPFTEVFDLNSLKLKMHRLGLEPKDFLVARDPNGSIVGCCASFSGQRDENLIPLSYSLRGHNFRQFLKFFWLLGYTRRLTKPVRSTGLEEPLRYRHLSFVFADNEDIFESLLWQTFENADENEFLAYAHNETDIRYRPPESWVSASLPHALYSVLPPGSEMPDFINPTSSIHPEIESFFI